MTRYRTIVADPPWDLSARSGEVSRQVPYATMSIEAIKALPVKAMADNLDADTHLYLWTVNAYLRDAYDVARSWGFHVAQVIVWAKPGEYQRIGGAWPSNVEFALFCRRPAWIRRVDALRVTTYLADAAKAAEMTPKQVDDAVGTKRMAQVWWLTKVEHRCACPSPENWTKLKAVLALDDEMDDLVAEINARKGTAERQKLARAPSSFFQWPRGEHSAKPEAFLDLVEQVSPGPYLELFARRARFGWHYWGDQSLGTAEMPAA